MPRREANAPTERIIRILDDVQLLEDYCDVVDRLLAEHCEAVFHLFPSRPSLEAVLQERARQTIMLEQTRAKRAYAKRKSSLAKDHKELDL